MDPNETPSIIRELIEIGEHYEAAGAFDALDKWLTYGCFLPTDWQR